MFRSTRLQAALICVGAVLLVAPAWGDSLELSNGSMIKGKYLGGTESTITFQVGSAEQRYPVADVVSITFDAASRAAGGTSTRPATTSGAPRLAQHPLQPAGPAPRALSQAAPVAARANTINVPTGTRIMIRTIDAIDSSRNQVGDKFQATLEQPLIVDDVTVAPKGTDVYGHLTQAAEAGRIQGRSQLKLELTGIVLNGQTVPLVTGDYAVTGSSRGASTAKKAGGGAAVGALIGAIAGGGKGAAIGAGVGAGAGTAVQVMSKGEKIHVPSETLIEFTLQQDVRMPVVQ
jgi:hypothetical protein